MDDLRTAIIEVMDDEAQFGNHVYADELVNRVGSTREEVKEVLEQLLDEGVIVGIPIGDGETEFDVVFELAPREP